MYAAIALSIGDRTVFDSVFSQLLNPFPDDEPLLPVAEIERALDAIEQDSLAMQMQILTAQTTALLQQATLPLATGNLAAIAALDWNAAVALQAPIFRVWTLGWTLGSVHMRREMIAAVPIDLLPAAPGERQFAKRKPIPKSSIVDLLNLQPGTLINTPAEQAVLRRVNRLAGNFANDQLSQLRTDLIATISPDAQGQTLSRKQLLDRIQTNLQVAKARASAIARTELTYAYNVSRVQTALQSPLVTHLRFLAIGDDRTTDICRSRNGMLIPVAEAGAIALHKPPCHVNCRSTLSPVMADINPTHQEWAKDPDRDWQTRALVPLPPGWQPEALPSVPTPPPAPTQPKPKATRKPKPKDFPDTLDKLQEVRQLGGSTGAMLMEDPTTGKRYVLKKGASADHLEEEMFADAAYQALGVPVPKFKRYEMNGKPVKLAEFVEGQSLQSLLASGDALAAEQAIAQLRKNFAADALLGNWDVIGLNFDNVLIDRAGKVWRIDNGGSLRFRAMGDPKGDRWNDYPTELWSLRDDSVNAQTAAMFGSLKHRDLLDQIDAISSQQKKLLKALPAELRDTVQARIAQMQHLTTVSKTLLDDEWKEAYVSDFAKHTLGVRAAGMVDRMPQQLTQTETDATEYAAVYAYDEQGQLFDSLRDQGSIMADFDRYLRRFGSGYDAIIGDWMEQQASDSWANEAPRSLKYFFANQRSVPRDRYFWRFGESKSRDSYQQVSNDVGPELYQQTLTAWHAFNHELLLKVKFARKNKNGTVTLMRTENREVMQTLNQLKPGDRNQLIQRGFAESTSVYKKVSVFGTEMTLQNVPLHRIFGTYWTEKFSESGEPGFIGDGENEFIALMDGIPLDYLRFGDDLNAELARKQREAGGSIL